jgi:excisionase family DNA binding protein
LSTNPAARRLFDERVRDMRGAGMTVSVIARELDIQRTTVYRAIRRLFVTAPELALLKYKRAVKFTRADLETLVLRQPEPDRWQLIAAWRRLREYDMLNSPDAPKYLRPAEPAEPDWSASLNLTEAAAYLRVHPGTLRRLVKAQGIPGFKVGTDWRIRPEVLEQWRREREAERDAEIKAESKAAPTFRPRFLLRR